MKSAMKQSRLSLHRETLRAQIVHLAAGELGPLASWRLRRQIARDPELGREWKQVHRLWGDLQTLQRAPVPSTVRPVWPFPRAERLSAPPFILGGIIMKRRTVFAALALVLLLVSGAVAGRQWLQFTPNFSVSDTQGHLWFVKTKFRGKVTLLDAQERKIGQFLNDYPLSDPTSGTVHLTYAHRLQADFKGEGRHEVYEEDGSLLGYVELSPLTPDDERKLAEQKSEFQQVTEEMYRLPERVTPSNEHHGYAEVVSYPGLVAGYFGHQGVSWKVYGYAQVKARCLAGPEPDEQQGKTGALTSLDQLPPPMRDMAARLNALAPRPGDTPRIVWARAGENQTEGDTVQHAGDYALQNGQWTAVRASGTISGYGRHAIKDENGKTVLILEVSPLTTSGPAR